MTSDRLREAVRKADKRLDSLKEIRLRRIPLWQNITKYVVPTRGFYDTETPAQYGERKSLNLLDTTPVRALGILQAGMQSGLTSPSRPWFKLTVSDNNIASSYNVMRWLDDVEEIITDVFARSNFYNSMHGLYGEVAAFGVGVMLIDEDPETVINCTLLTAGEYCLGFNARGRANALGRQYWMTSGQLVERFGIDKVSESTKNAYQNGNVDEWVKVDHMIFEDDPDDPTSIFPYASMYWEDGRQEPLEISGYYDFPVIVVRWDVVGTDYYGVGPGWLAADESKTLQELRYDLLVANKLSIDPPMQAPESARKDRVSTRPGAVNYSNADNGYRPMLQVQFDIPGQMAQQQQSREIINSILFSDVFLMIAQQEVGKMTATEAMIRNEEKMQMLGPVIERMDHEGLDPSISRTYNILGRGGSLPPMPEELTQTRVRVEYVSTLALAQKSANLDTIGGFLELTSGLAGIDPQVVDKINADEIADSFVKNTSMPADFVRSPEEVAAIREERAAMQAESQRMQEMAGMAQMADTGAHAVNQMAGAQMAGGGSALDQMLEGLVGNAGGGAA